MKFLFEAEYDAARQKADRLAASDYENALSEYKTAYNLATTSGQQIYALGGIVTTLMNLENFDEAEKFNNKILELNPNNKWAKGRKEMISSSRPVATATDNTMDKLEKTLEQSGQTIDTVDVTGKLDDVLGDKTKKDELENLKQSLDDEALPDIEDIDAEEEELIKSTEKEIAKAASISGTSVTKENMEKAPQPKADSGTLDTVLSFIGELTGISGLFRSSDAIWEWVWGNDKAEYDKAFRDMFWTDIVDFVFWIGTIISVAIAAAAGSPFAGIGAAISGGAAAVVAFLGRIAAKKVTVRVAIAGVFKAAGRYIAKHWYVGFKNLLFRKQHMKTFAKQMRKQGIPRQARKKILKSFKESGKINNKLFSEAMKSSNKGAKHFSKLGRKGAKEIYDAINDLSIPEKLNIINRMRLGKYLFTSLAKAPFKAGIKVAKSPFDVPEKLFLSGFKENKLTMGLLKKYNLLQLFDLGTVLTEIIANSLAEDADGIWSELGQSIVEFFQYSESVKMVMAEALWEYRTNDGPASNARKQRIANDKVLLQKALKFKEEQGNSIDERRLAALNKHISDLEASIAREG